MAPQPGFALGSAAFTLFPQQDMDREAPEGQTHFWMNKWLVNLLSRVRLFVTPWTVAQEAPPSMGFSRQEYWSAGVGCHFLLQEVAGGYHKNHRL